MLAFIFSVILWVTVIVCVLILIRDNSVAPYGLQTVSSALHKVIIQV